MSAALAIEAQEGWKWLEFSLMLPAAEWIN